MLSEAEFRDQVKAALLASRAKWRTHYVEGGSGIASLQIHPEDLVAIARRAPRPGEKELGELKAWWQDQLGFLPADEREIFLGYLWPQLVEIECG
jgi:hypothetical protein